MEKVTNLGEILAQTLVTQGATGSVSRPVKNWVLYVMIFPFPSMNKGKAMAHTGHACCDFMKKYGNCEEVLEWQKQSKQGTFGTQINVKWNAKVIGELDEIDAIVDGRVTDDTYPYRVANWELKNLIDTRHHTLPPTENKDGSWTCYRLIETAYYFFTTKEFAKTLNLELED